MLYPTIYKFSCLLNLRYFPYDLQECTMTFSSWTYDNKGLEEWATEQGIPGNFSDCFFTKQASITFPTRTASAGRTIWRTKDGKGTGWVGLVAYHILSLKVLVEVDDAPGGGEVLVLSQQVHSAQADLVPEAQTVVLPDQPDHPHRDHHPDRHRRILHVTQNGLNQQMEKHF